MSHLKNRGSEMIGKKSKNRPINRDRRSDLAALDELIRFWARSAQRQGSKVNELVLNMLYFPVYAITQVLLVYFLFQLRGTLSSCESWLIWLPRSRRAWRTLNRRTTFIGIWLPGTCWSGRTTSVRWLTLDWQEWSRLVSFLMLWSHLCVKPPRMSKFRKFPVTVTYYHVVPRITQH